MPEDSENEINILGQTNFRGQHRQFGIYPDDRRRHVYVVGKTGVGKSTLLENMIAQDIIHNKGVCLVDPHGDTVERLLNAVPPSRINDVVYFDPSDVDWPVAFNVLEAVDPAYKYLVASGLVSSLKKMWADSWGPRLEYILRNTILALLDYPSSTILGILRMLSDKTYRKKVVDKISDPVVKSFWTNEFANYNERFRTEAISPIQNKVGQLLSSAIIRNIVAQPKSTIDMKDIMDNGKILLVNMSKGKIGEDNSGLLGAMIINRIQLAAMDRASIPEEERRDFYLYVDEFQNFATESFADILSEARKYRLNLTVAHQYIAQMEEEVTDAVFGNVGTIVAFRVGAADAEYLEQEFAPVFTQTDLVNLDKYNAYLKLMINGISSKPFSMQALPPVMENFGKGEVVRMVSRERFGHKREIVEDKIRRWSGIVLGEAGEEQSAPQYSPRSYSGGERRPGRGRQTSTERHEARQAPAQINKEQLADVVLPISAKPITDLAAVLSQGPNTSSSTRRGSARGFEVICRRCGKKTEVPFDPDPAKPVYCKECFQIVRQEKAGERERKVNTVDARVSKRFSGPQPPALP
ncbi:MAG: CxxC-x17-CxxC domain-containing protein [Candidatus Andersenbacteria bacterium]|nr:type IV secretion system DNA-binding domain-containing protein [bacterium]MDZ4225839.1 CxxC-x17-CxxC domain-containing protein [Candidatus Andersenbacteria bacterium]